jgi:hypothetical protein
LNTACSATSLRTGGGKSLVTHEVIVKLIANTTTTKGLKVKAALDTKRYTTGRKISEHELAYVKLTKADFHGDWNYNISPHPTR